MTFKEQILEQSLLPFLKKYKIKSTNSHGTFIFECPKCKELSCSSTEIETSFKCNNSKCAIFGKPFTLTWLVKQVLPNRSRQSTDEILDFLRNEFKLDIVSTEEMSITQKHLDYYSLNGWSLFPVAKESKVPMEKEWTSKTHYDKSKWQMWIDNGLNVGGRTGKESNLTVIDVDVLSKEDAEQLAKAYLVNDKESIKKIETRRHLPKKIMDIMGEPAIHSTFKGFHLCYKYCSDMPKSTLDLGKTHLDIENDGGYILLHPSAYDVPEAIKVDGKEIKTGYISKRGFEEFKELKEIPSEFKQLLLDNLPKNKQIQSQSVDDVINDKLNQVLGNVEVASLKDGDGRNSRLISLIGLLRQRYGIKEVENFMMIINKYFFSPELSYNEIKAMVGSLEGYNEIDGSLWADRIIKHLLDVDEATARDVLQSLALGNNADKRLIDTILTSLVREGKIKKMNGKYSVRKELSWVSSLFETNVPIDFEMPYFDDIARFYKSNIILIGASTGCGKTILAMNFIQDIVAQGKKPYYIGTESDSGFVERALKLGIPDDSFLYPNPKEEIDLMDIEFPENGIVILDWIDPTAMGENGFAQVNKLFRHFKAQLRRSDGVLIAFMQLRDNGGWFSRDLVKDYPALAVKYLYTDKGEGYNTEFNFDDGKIRHRKKPGKQPPLPCKYDYKTCEVKRVESVDNSPLEEE